jgi:hypothetical protein
MILFMSTYLSFEDKNKQRRIAANTWKTYIKSQSILLDIKIDYKLININLMTYHINRFVSYNFLDCCYTIFKFNALY